MASPVRFADVKRKFRKLGVETKKTSRSGSHYKLTKRGYVPYVFPVKDGMVKQPYLKKGCKRFDLNWDDFLNA